MTAVATIVGASARRSMTQRASRIDDPYADEDFDTFEGDRSYAVTTPDGVPLAVRETGPVDARVTMVFVHGFCLRMGEFAFQRRATGGIQASALTHLTWSALMLWYLPPLFERRLRHHRLRAQARVLTNAVIASRRRSTSASST